MFGVLVLISAVATINPVWSYGPDRADQVSTGAQPDWYLGFAEGLVRVMPGWEISVAGHTLVLGCADPHRRLPAASGRHRCVPVHRVVGHGRPARAPSLLDRPRNRPVRTSIGAAWISLYLILLAGGGNDIVATRFHLWIEHRHLGGTDLPVRRPGRRLRRNRRICLGLQLRDRELVAHGRATGVVKRLPHSECVEVHRPLRPAELHTLTEHEHRDRSTAGTSNG